MENFDSSFNAILPQAMLDDFLSRGEELSHELLYSLQEAVKKRSEFRNQLDQSGLLCKDSDLPFIKQPTTCAIDGASIIERLMAIDLIACAAVAVEGLTPPQEEKFWPDMKHRIFVRSEMHNPESSLLVGGIMWTLELELAAQCPHEIVFIDGSITNPIIKMNAAVQKANSSARRSDTVKKILNEFESFLLSYQKIVCSSNSNNFWISMPKYTSKREIGELLNWSESYDDRSLLMSILESGEFTKPLPYKQPKDEENGSDWHLDFPSNLKSNTTLKKVFDEIKHAIHKLHVIYYKPNSYSPVLRIEIPKYIADNKYRLAKVLLGIKSQLPTPSILEPYPLFIADNIAKEISKAIPAMRQIATRKMAESFDGDFSFVLMSMHSYRSETHK